MIPFFPWLKMNCRNCGIWVSLYSLPPATATAWAAAAATIRDPATGRRGRPNLVAADPADLLETGQW